MRKEKLTEGEPLSFPAQKSRVKQAQIESMLVFHKHCARPTSELAEGWPIF